MTGTTDGTLILSPHPDDAALSIAGALAKGLFPPPVTLVTVFDRTNFGGGGELGGLDETTALRAREDDSFAEMVGAEIIRLGMIDACVRHGDRSIAALFEPGPPERALSADLVVRLNDLAEANASPL